MKISELKSRYERGENVSQIVRDGKGVCYNDDRVIELAYEMQAGTYIKGMKEDIEIDKKRNRYMDEFVSIIQKYIPNPKSLLKGGVGEAVTLVPMLKGFRENISYVYGFDICWSRLAYGRRWLKDNSLMDVKLAMGTLSEIPFMDNSFDIVVTSHSMEPNGGREEEILKELYRVAGSYLFLAEPSYEYGSDEVKKRMENLGYVKGLEDVARNLGYDVVENRPIVNIMSKNNPTSVIVIRKKQASLESPVYACPQSKKPLIQYSSCFYSDECLCAYPVIEGIPCLRTSCAVVCSKMTDLIIPPPKIR